MCGERDACAMPVARTVGWGHRSDASCEFLAEWTRGGNLEQSVSVPVPRCNHAIRFFCGVARDPRGVITWDGGLAVDQLQFLFPPWFLRVITLDRCVGLLLYPPFYTRSWLISRGFIVDTRLHIMYMTFEKSKVGWVLTLFFSTISYDNEFISSQSHHGTTVRRKKSFTVRWSS